MSKPFISLLILSSLIAFSGCEPAQHKTESMLKLEKAQQIASEHIAKASQQLDPITAENLNESVDDLLLAWGAYKNARQAFSSRNIQDYAMPKLASLEQQLIDFETAVAVILEQDLRQAIELTSALREQIVKVKNKPYHARNNDTDEIVARLSSDYNKALQACCKNRIAQATKVLMQSKNNYQSLKKLGLNLDYYMEEVIRDSAAEKTLLTMLND